MARGALLLGPRPTRTPAARLIDVLASSFGVAIRVIITPERATAMTKNADWATKILIEALGALEPVWDELYPAEQARILRLLIERIDVAPDGISVTLHTAGIRSLVAELADQEPPAPAASEPLLEAAE